MSRRHLYQRDHVKLRRRILQAQAQGMTLTCWRCGQTIPNGEPWDLGHSDTTTRHMGPEHQKCNRSTTRPYPPQKQRKRQAERHPTDPQ